MPKQRAGIISSAKERVAAADAPINQNRCLIQNMPNFVAVKNCHVLRHNTSGNSTLKTSLEHAWNMEHNSLNLDTRYNIFLVGETMRVLYNRGYWRLLPSRDIIEQYLSASTGIVQLDRKSFPDIPVPREGFKYRFIAFNCFPAVAQMCIARRRYIKKSPGGRKDHPVFEAPCRKDPEGRWFRDELHYFPFQTMPDLWSHIHPKFVIVSLAQTVRSLPTSPDHESQAFKESMGNDWPIIQGAVQLYLSWTNQKISLLREAGEGSCQDWDGTSEGSDNNHYNANHFDDGNNDAGANGNGGGAPTAAGNRTNTHKPCKRQRRADSSSHPNKKQRTRKQDGDVPGPSIQCNLGDLNKANHGWRERGAEDVANWTSSVLLRCTEDW